MKISSLAETILLPVILMLCLYALTGCWHLPPVILQQSQTIRIQPGDLKSSPDFKGWALSGQSVAKLLEAAEVCQEKK